MTLKTKAFGDIITFTRASGGGRFNSSGVYEWLGNDVPRLDYDPVTLQPRGILIEEQRTNLLMRSTMAGTSPMPTGWSSYFGAGGAAQASLYGSDSLAWRFVSSASRNFVSMTVSLSASTTYSFSVLVESNVNGLEAKELILPANWPSGASISFPLADTYIPSPGERIHFVISIGATAGTVQFRVGTGCNGVVTGSAVLSRPQLEAGAFPTSYIPTVASQVTRSADVASVNTLSPWYRQDEGTLFVEFLPNPAYPVAAKAIAFAALSDNSYSNRISLASSTGTAQLNFDIRSAGTDYRTIAGNLSQGVSKIAGAYKAAASSMASLNGSLVSGPGAPTLAALSKLNVGASHDGSAVINGHIRNISYYPRRLSNSELQGITA